MTEESCIKLSESLKLYYKSLSEEQRKELSIKAHNRWKNLPQELKDKMSKERHDNAVGEKNPMYGKSCTDFMTDDEILLMKIHSSEATKKLWQNPEYRNKVLSATLLNPNIDHDCRKYMTAEEILRWKANISIATSGENNPMYGKNSWEKCTPEQRIDRAKRFSQNMKGKNKGRKMMQLPGTNELKFVHSNDVQSYLDQGYVYSSKNKRKYISQLKT